MDPVGTLAQFSGTWTLLPEMCKYEHGEVPKSATHTFQLTANPIQLRFIVEWKEANDKEHHHEYDVLVDGQPHELNVNGYIMTMTATASGTKLKLHYTRVDCDYDFECDSTTGEMPLNFRTLVEGKWYNLYQLYRKQK